MQIEIATLGDCREHNYRITLYCDECSKSKTMNIDQAIQRLGVAYPCLKKDLQKVLRCETCNRPPSSMTLAYSFTNKSRFA